jgi:hypothetical protein
VRLLSGVAGEQDIERFESARRDREAAGDQQDDHSSYPDETGEGESTVGRCTERGRLALEGPMRRGTETEDITGRSARLFEVLDVTRSKEDELLIVVVFVELLGLDPSGLDEVQDPFFALAGEERGLRGQDPLGQVPRRVSLAH